MAETGTVEDEEQEPEPTKEAPKLIKPIDKNSVHRICSGQVVLTLAVAVKELVENSIDAGATLVEVKLYDQGLESVEVSDNGSGVPEANLEAMTAKYHTSKLQEFDDLLSVETFGFRGEALSSLCALSYVSIVTRHKRSDVGIKIELDNEGRILKRSYCSRSIGTTVTLKQLFITLPVRRRDFMRNIKREFTKMCNMMQAYCLAAKGVRIICSNHTSKAGKSVVLQTHGSKDVLANISAVFGVRQTNELLEIKPAFHDLNALTKETLLEELQKVDSKADTLQITSNDLDSLKESQLRFEGYISSCNHGRGRSSKDRQFFYINWRPCDSKNLSKVVNDIYRRYNAHEYPFVYLNVVIKRADVDINVTPDKRLLFLKNEKILLMFLKRALLNTFGNIPGQQKFENTSVASIFKVEPKIKVDLEKPSKIVEVVVPEEDAITNADATADNKAQASGNPSQPEEDTLVPISTAKKFMDVLSQWRRTGDTTGSAPVTRRVTGTKRKCMNEIEARTLKMQKIQNYLTQELPKSSESSHFSSYKSDSESDKDEGNSTAETTSPNQSFPCIEKINKASQEYDLLTSSSTVQRIDCKISGPAKSFLPFIKKTSYNQHKYDSEGDSLPNTQESTVSKESYDFNFPSNSSASQSTENVDYLSLEKPMSSDSECEEYLNYSKFSPSKVNQDESYNFDLPSTSLATRKQLIRSSSISDGKHEDENEDGDKKKLELKLSIRDEESNSECESEAESNASKSSIPKTIVLDEPIEEADEDNLSCAVLKTSIDEIAALMEAEKKYMKEQQSKKKQKRLRFKSEINPSDNKKAEQELQTEISKSDFARMEIIGQFNLGFIIVKLDDDLFIVDQHASDEKYNFEKLQETTVVQSQRLVVPQKLELTTVNEMVLLDHLHVFEKNGFQFEVDENAPPMHKVRLIAKPVSKNWDFGKEDIDELIFMLQDAPSGTVCRPSRVRTMFASRACRKSVMIGTRMNEVDMKTLVTHMGEIEQPWNCPHGRPTIRHLINLTMLPDDSDDSDNESDDNGETGDAANSKTVNDESDCSDETGDAANSKTVNNESDCSDETFDAANSKTVNNESVCSDETGDAANSKTDHINT